MIGFIVYFTMQSAWSTTAYPQVNTPSLDARRLWFSPYDASIIKQANLRYEDKGVRGLLGAFVHTTLRAIVRP